MAAGSQRFGLLAEKHRVDHHAVADDVGLAALEDAGRNRAQDILLTAEFQRVTGIGTALEAGHHFIAGRQHIHDLSFSLVPPLQAEDHIYFFHCNRFIILSTKDIFSIQRYKIFSETPNLRRGVFSKKRFAAKAQPETDKKRGEPFALLHQPSTHQRRTTSVMPS